MYLLTFSFNDNTYYLHTLILLILELVSSHCSDHEAALLVFGRQGTSTHPPSNTHHSHVLTRARSSPTSSRPNSSRCVSQTSTTSPRASSSSSSPNQSTASSSSSTPASAPTSQLLPAPPPPHPRLSSPACASFCAPEESQPSARLAPTVSSKSPSPMGSIGSSSSFTLAETSFSQMPSALSWDC